MRRFSYVKSKYPGVLLLGLVSFFADIASEMLYPITPIFLTSIIGASMTNLGIIEGIAEGIASLLKTYSGFWSDRISKRKLFIFVGYFISALSRPLIGLSTSALHILGARTTDRIGKGLRTAPRDALIADYVESKDRGLAFGWHRSIDTLGAVVGPLLGLLVLTYVSDLRKIYYWALVPGLVSVLVILFLREPPKNLTSSSNFQFKWKILTYEYKYFLISWGIFCLTNSSDAFLILKMKEEGLSTSSVLLIYAFYNLFYAILSPYLGGLSDKWSKRKILTFGMFLFSIVYIGFSLANHWTHFLILMSIYGIYMAATDGVSKAYITELVPSDFKGSALGIFGTVVGFAQIVASIFTGLIWDQYGSSMALIFSSVGSIVFIIVHLFHFKKAR